MVDRGASVLARLKNIAYQTGRSNQHCLQLFCQEEFLRRLEKSEYVDNFILKGGYFIYILTDFDSRETYDIDFLLRQIPSIPERVIPVIGEIFAVQTGNDFISFEITGTKPIALAQDYVGIGVSVVGCIKNTRTPFRIDFGIGDVVVPSPEKRAITTQLDGFVSPMVNTYSVETVIAEKIDAILDRMQMSSRMKDYFDIYYLASRFNFKGDSLTDAIRQTFTNRNRNYETKRFTSVVEFSNNDEMQKKWYAFIKKNLLYTEILDIVVALIIRFI